MDQKFKSKKYHLVGVGGAGMRALAWFLHQRGAIVTGSDLSDTQHTRLMQDAKMRIFKGHDAAQVTDDVDVVVISSAIDQGNCEYQAAISKQIPILGRAKMLNLLLEDTPHQIAIAGTHGKTSTTAIVTQLFEAAGLLPSYFIGSEIQGRDLNMAYGHSSHFIFETDESDGSFLEFHPTQGIVTNIEEEHMNYFKTRESLIRYFELFLDQISGPSYLNLDDELLSQFSQSGKWSVVGFSLKNPSAKYRAAQVSFDMQGGAHFELWVDGSLLGKIRSPLLGIHNVYNLLAAIALSLDNGIDFQVLQKACTQLKSTGRRVEKVFENNNWVFYDDYAHHPTEVRSTLAGLKPLTRGRLVAIFQPHRYSRTQDLLEEFAQCFGDADEVVLTDIYSAAEDESQYQVHATQLYKRLMDYHPQVVYCPQFDDILAHIWEHAKPGDVFVTMGAGNITYFGRNFSDRSQSSHQKQNPALTPE